jgi:hypothetical protein
VGNRTQITSTGSWNDDCGNTLSLTYSGNVYRLWFNGKEIGTCVYQNGVNLIYYWKTVNGKRFHSTWHRSHDPDHDGSAADEGTKYKYDWVVWTYDCITDPGSPSEYCREATTWDSDYGESDGDPSACE